MRPFFLCERDPDAAGEFSRQYIYPFFVDVYVSFCEDRTVSVDLRGLPLKLDRRGVCRIPCVRFVKIGMCSARLCACFGGGSVYGAVLRRAGGHCQKN